MLLITDDPSLAKLYGTTSYQITGTRRDLLDLAKLLIISCGDNCAGTQNTIGLRAEYIGISIERKEN